MPQSYCLSLLRASVLFFAVLTGGCSDTIGPIYPSAKSEGEGNGEYYVCKVCDGSGCSGTMTMACSICGGKGTIQSIIDCPTCLGIGNVKDIYGDLVKCPQCDGAKKIIETQICNKCNGSGEQCVPCSSCNGTGKVLKN